ncbi:hypothetical protein GCM10007170_45140 [Arthrobacter liuii]|uniref:Uncharacterized protein n=1 Tax=Arthrobacter liuii TaxID=1476996 RepID=A0ABQ2AZB8_9MICC|nr:hypothetical protein GCM10007170_45140 [Arthrobacter liuii]
MAVNKGTRSLAPGSPRPDGAGVGSCADNEDRDYSQAPFLIETLEVVPVQRPGSPFAVLGLMAEPALPAFPSL